MIRYLALGDSYTVGTGVKPSESWPAQLAAALIREGYPAIEPRIVAVNGWATDELITGIETARLQDSYELVSLQIGVNNQYRGRSLANYRSELRQLLKLAIRLANNKGENIIVVSIPDWGVTPFARNHDRTRVGAEIVRFNQVKSQEAFTFGAMFVDVTAISRQAGEESELFAGDGLHPAAKQYAAWVELILPVARAILDRDL